MLEKEEGCQRAASHSARAGGFEATEAPQESLLENYQALSGGRGQPVGDTPVEGGGRSVGLVGHGDISGLHDNRLSDTDSGTFILIIG
jgi:hypothetical protein